MAKPTLVLREDIVGGAAVAALAGVGYLSTNQLELGSLAEIGPGLFPWALALILLVFSLALVVVGFGEKTGGWSPSFSWRGLAGILGALLVFALFIRGGAYGPLPLPGLGVTGATPLAIMTAGLADRDTRWGQLAFFAACLTVFCTGLFRYALGLPLPVAPWLIGY